MVDVPTGELQETVGSMEIPETHGARGRVDLLDVNGLRDDVSGEYRLLSIEREQIRLENRGHGAIDEMLPNDKQRVRSQRRIDLDHRLWPADSRARNRTNDVRRRLRNARIVEHFQRPAIVRDVHMHGIRHEQLSV